ncbi:sulfatase [Muricauda sp. SCSIO 64092]|uniref:sulfatase n=1 Tax=Allomuricauda sp. SCSIO 64092 TaxID=2908842 RepID=UPI001FF220B6|nr:sulfatase [Muricauda sp. SCSIO 64092]UOY04939.1 sulfatase [Muricauda sp. SCSIO 64092]
MKLQKVALAICFTLGACNTNQTKEKSSGKKPNVLFILVDDFGYHDMSVMGSKYYETPNIDRIATQGVMFTNGYATSRVCSPSRASILTGKFTARHGITDWIGAKTGKEWREKGRHSQLLPPEYVRNLPQKYVTLPEAMKEVGYKTFFAGKWHIGGKGSWPENHGFDTNKGGWDTGGPIGGYFSPWANPNLPNKIDGENLPMRLANETADFIKKHKDTTFFAYLSFYAVHSPIQTTQQKWLKYRNKADSLGITDKGFKMGHFFPIRQVQDNPIYAGLVETMDEAVGHVLKTLEELGLDENTIVVFTSDNGGVVAGDAYATSNKPLRAGKGYQFEGGIREPYFIKVPWLACGKKNHVPVSGTDFYPTILELIGARLKPEEHQDGVSLVPLLKGKSLQERPLIWHYPHYGNQGGEPSSIIREGNWKLIHYYEDGREELYNLKNDIEEANNTVANNPELAKRLSRKLFDYLHKVGARFPEKDPEYNAEKEHRWRERQEKMNLPAWENRRIEYLSKDFDPKNNWWGSKVGD